MESFILIKPTMEYAEQIAEYRKSFLKSGDSMDGTGPLRRMEDIYEYIKFCIEGENPAMVPANLVPATQFIFVRTSDNQLVGMIQVRHYFNDFLERFGGHIGYSIRPEERRKGYAKKMLNMVLSFCREMGLERVLVSCIDGNIASEKTILGNDGVYESTVYEPVRQIYLKRFWINTMEKNYKQKIIEKYADGREVNRQEKMGKYPMEFIYTKKALDTYINTEKRVAEIGCGGGYYLMHYASKCKEYLGIDLSPVNVEVARKQIIEKDLKNASVEVGDATNLAGIADASYDVVLCLGPLYHLKPEERDACISECKRICAPGGFIAFAFINKTGAIAKYGGGDSWQAVLTTDVGESVMKYGSDKKNWNVFYFTMPEELLAATEKQGLKKVRMTGLDFLLLEETIESFTEEQRSIWFQFADMVAGSEYATALSNHALLICQKD